MAYLKSFPIEYIRTIFEQKLLEQHNKDNHFFGGTNQIALSSFYEQLKGQDEIDRFVETYRDLTEQQNRMGLIGNGVILAPENPTYTNLYSATIIPLTWTCSIRCTLENRDQMIDTINNLIEQLKGIKVDVAEISAIDDNGNSYMQPFMVGTLGQYRSGVPKIKNGDFIGSTSIANIATRINTLATKGITMPTLSQAQTLWVYYLDGGILRVALNYYNSSTSSRKWKQITNDGTYNDIIFPPEHSGLAKYKVSFSFDSIRCDEPRNLNSQEYCEISFGGSATLVNESVKLGNDLLYIRISKKKIIADTPYTYSTNNHYLEPLEMPSGINANTNPISLVSNHFISNTHTDSLALSLQYTFILDTTKILLTQWFDYARYGTQGIATDKISPNTIYEITEYWSSWGSFESKIFNAKIVESIDIENTESDTLTISVPFQIQGENN